MSSRKWYKKYRFVENLHIFFWLIKDSCWMMEWKIPGIFMIVPTLCLAIWMIFRTRHHPECWINLSVLVWVSANSWWMVAEFIQKEHLKIFSSFPFLMGFVFFSVYVYRYQKSEDKEVL